MDLDSPFFKRSEFECSCGCGFGTVDAELLTLLGLVRSYFREPVVITSGCRCAEHNAKVGGAPNSLHTQGRAADFYVRNVSLASVHLYCQRLLVEEGGLGYYPRQNGGWIHIDSRSDGPARWNG